MNCDWIRESATLYIYDELEEEARREFEIHLSSCPDCRAEVDSQVEFKRLLTPPPMPVVSANLLAVSRMRLQEAIEREPSKRWWDVLVFDFTASMRQIRLSPAVAAMLLIAGFTGGSLTSYRMLASQGAPPVAAVGNTETPVQASIAGIRGIAQDPDSNQVRIQFDTLTPQSMQGSLDDPEIQKLLLYAARIGYNTGVRVDSIGLLAKESLGGRSSRENSGDTAIRDALVYALHSDMNPGVRLKALSGLQPFVATDIGVRDSVLEALTDDANPGVRSEAIAMLSAVGADTSVRETLQHLAAGDDDGYIKIQSQRLLASFPDVQ